MVKQLKNIHSMSNQYKVGELFAGIGGIGLGFIEAGFDVVWANEIDAKASYTYSKNFSHRIINDDMQNIDASSLPSIDVLTGGFPCQAFSIAGYQKGFKDDRGNIFFDIIRYIQKLKPKVIFLENVKNLSSHDKGNTFKVIQEELRKNGYYIKAQVLNTCEYSTTPQNRERIYIVGFRNKKQCDNFLFPSKIAETKKIAELLEHNVGDEFYYDNNKKIDVLKKEITKTDTIYQWRRVYVRENKSDLCPTLTANMGTGGHNVPLILDGDRIRKLTPRECVRFQGFPDEFILPEDLPNSALYKQIGNSVSVPVVQRIAQNILEVLEH